MAKKITPTEDETTISTLMAFRFIIYEEGTQLRASLPVPKQRQIAVAKERYEKGELKTVGMETIVKMCYTIVKPTQWKLKKSFAKKTETE